MSKGFAALILVLLFIIVGYQEYQDDRQAFLTQQASAAANTLKNDPNITALEARNLADIVNKAVDDGVVEDYYKLGIKSHYDTEKIVHEAENREAREAELREVEIRQQALNAVNRLKNDPTITALEARKLADIIHESVEAGVVTYSELGVGSYYTIEEMVTHVEQGVDMQWIKGN